MTKQELRKVYSQKRSSLSDHEYDDLNHKMSNCFFNHIDLSHVRILHIFIPIPKKKEPDTGFIIDRFRKEYPAIELVAPRINDHSGLLESFFFEDEQQLEQNKWGIPEPKHGRMANTQAIDMVIVPLLAFDKEGHRVGYGKGFYDIFISACRADCKKVGLSLFGPEEAIEDIECHDQKLDYAITPTTMYKFY